MYIQIYVCLFACFCYIYQYKYISPDLRLQAKPGYQKRFLMSNAKIHRKACKKKKKNSNNNNNDNDNYTSNNNN